MITLYKDQSKNDKLKAVIADLRSKIGASDGIPWSFKYFHPDGKVRWLMEKYDIKSKAMAKKNSLDHHGRYDKTNRNLQSSW